MLTFALLFNFEGKNRQEAKHLTVPIPPLPVYAACCESHHYTEKVDVL